MRRFFYNKEVLVEDLNISNWENVYTGNMSELEMKIFSCRKKAIDLFFTSELPIGSIIKETGIGRSEIYRLVSRCLMYDESNKILGYRGLIHYKTLTSYSRKSFDNLDLSNYSGAFQLLLKTYPELKTFLIEEYFKKSKSKNNARELKISYKNLHRKFIDECRKLGIRPNEYPFNTTSLARKSVERFIKDISSNYIQEVAKNSGGQSTMLLNNVNNSINTNSTITRPLERVEFDGHKIDLILALVYQTPQGEQIIDILNRIWLLTIVDIATRAVLGYHLTLSKEYTEEDIKKCFQSAILPWKPKKLTISGLKYSKNAGFPSYKFPEAQYGKWDEICYDNAKSNLSKGIKDILRKQIGCSINMGPVAVPVRRPIIERLFKGLEENGFHRLPSTTGSNVLDSRRYNAEENAIKFSISPENIEELCDVIIANYNGNPHDSNNGFSPLEIFESRINQGMHITQIPVDERDSVNLFPISAVRQVKGNLEQGRRPYIHFKNVRYSSSELSRDFLMINEKLTILINTDDLRTVIAFRQDGSKYGVLTASGYWGITPHSLKIRNAINKFKRERYFHYTEDEDPIDAFQAFLEEKAINDKKLRNLLAEVKSYKKKYNIESKNKEKKKVIVKIKKEQQELQQEIIEERKISNSNDVSNESKEDEIKSVHEFLIHEKINQKVNMNSPISYTISETKNEIKKNNLDFKNTEITESNYYDELIESKRSRNNKKRKSINF